ncbi:MAG: S1C family serine protease [Pseudomonadota bacterium]
MCRCLLTLWVMCLASAVAAEPLTTLRNGALFRVVAQGPNGQSLGTAFKDAQGRVITAYHVIDGASHILLHDFEGRIWEDVTLHFMAPTRDLALLMVDGLPKEGGYPLNTNAGAGAAGATVALHGAPLGMERTVLAGRRAVAGLQSGAVWVTRDPSAPDPETAAEVSIFRDPGIQVLPLDITVEGGGQRRPHCR